MNYRCRSAFKLLEINEKYKILKFGYIVIDCGAAPGSWSQIAAKCTNSDQSSGDKLPKGEVFGIDLLQIYPIKGVTLIDGMDFTSSSTQHKLKSLLNNRTVNCVLSDMAPNATGVKVLDQENIINLCYSVLRFAILMSAEGGNLLMKTWDNGLVSKLENDVQQFYENVKRVKPQSSRSDSAEMFILARNFKGILKENNL